MIWLVLSMLALYLGLGFDWMTSLTDDYRGMPDDWPLWAGVWIAWPWYAWKWRRRV